MENQTEEQKDHFSSDRNHWCIVEYWGGTPTYYSGYYGKNDGEAELKPAFGTDFNNAAKFHSRIAAQFVLDRIRQHGYKHENAKVEDHRWM